jgi:3-keto steroid reductase
MSASKPSLGARVIWTSSIESAPTFYNPEDWQLVKTEYSYAVVKYQIDLLATRLDGLAVEQEPRCSSATVRHVVVQPGVVGTNISGALVSGFMDFVKIVTFYMV